MENAADDFMPFFIRVLKDFLVEINEDLLLGFDKKHLQQEEDPKNLKPREVSLQAGGTKLLLQQLRKLPSVHEQQDMCKQALGLYAEEKVVRTEIPFQ
jgi:hypothetical protein